MRLKNLFQLFFRKAGKVLIVELGSTKGELFLHLLNRMEIRLGVSYRKNSVIEKPRVGGKKRGPAIPSCQFLTEGSYER